VRSAVLAVLAMMAACAPTPAMSTGEDGGAQESVTIDLPLSSSSAESGMPIEASFTLSGVESANELPAGVVRILVDTGAEPQTVGLVNLRDPSDASLNRSVLLDLSSALTPEQLETAERVNMTFSVEVAPGAPEIGLEAVEARVAE
jgi:hypothetical protein